MSNTSSTSAPMGFRRIFAWPRLKPMLIACLLVSLLLSTIWTSSYAGLIARLLFIGLSQVLVFGIFERWPRRLPRWLARWVLQVAGVAFVVPFAVLIGYSIATMGDAVAWHQDKKRLTGFGIMTFWGMLLGPWMAMSALYRYISGEAQRQVLAFDLERSQYERNALDARMRLLQAQVEPHFLFNTLANVRELVDSGSPQASAVLASLIAYLRAAVPRLNETGSTVQQELELVRAYLEVMHMRMPDRLQFTVKADGDALPLSCPSMTLLTLVENAVRHGIDPSEEGGRIEVIVNVRDGMCRAQVIDTGVGMQSSGGGLGTGLSNLRERLQLAFGDAATLRLGALQPRGVRAEMEFPARLVPT